MEFGTLVLMLVSIYPLMTTMLGQDPFYNLAGIRSCNDSGRNQCGTFPYQVKAAMGHTPRYSDAEDERSLESTHNEAKGKPHHKTWKVDRDPILYPDEKTMEQFTERERRMVS